LEFKGFLQADTRTLSDHLSYEATTTDSKKEVWLIRLPFDMDPSCLTNRKVVLGVKQDIALMKDGKRTSFEVASEQADKSSYGYCLLPSHTGGLLPAQQRTREFEVPTQLRQTLVTQSHAIIQQHNYI
jgi:hypothetical protein